MKRVAITTLGCKTNQFESSAIGRTVEVLVEHPAEGHSREYPRIRLERPDPRLVNRLVPVEVLADEGGSVLGRPVDPTRPGS